MEKFEFEATERRFASDRVFVSFKNDLFTATHGSESLTIPAIKVITYIYSGVAKVLLLG